MKPRLEFQLWGLFLKQSFSSSYNLTAKSAIDISSGDDHFDEIQTRIYNSTSIVLMWPDHIRTILLSYTPCIISGQIS
jgi:hypothetical protein